MHFTFDAGWLNIVAVAIAGVDFGPANFHIYYLFDSLQFIPNYLFNLPPNFIQFNFMCFANSKNLFISDTCICN